MKKLFALALILTFVLWVAPVATACPPVATTATFGFRAAAVPCPTPAVVTAGRARLGARAPVFVPRVGFRPIVGVGPRFGFRGISPRARVRINERIRINNFRGFRRR